MSSGLARWRCWAGLLVSQVFPAGAVVVTAAFASKRHGGAREQASKQASNLAGVAAAYACSCIYIPHFLYIIFIHETHRKALAAIQDR